MSKERLKQNDTLEIPKSDSVGVQGASIIETLETSKVRLVIPENLLTLTIELPPLNLASDLLSEVTLPSYNISLDNWLPVHNPCYDVMRTIREEQNRTNNLLNEFSNPFNTTVRLVSKIILNRMLPEDTISNIESFLGIKKTIVSLPYDELTNLMLNIQLGNVPVGRNIYENFYVKEKTIEEMLNKSNVNFPHLLQNLNYGVIHPSFNEIIEDVIIPAPHENDFAIGQLLLTGQNIDQVTQ